MMSLPAMVLRAVLLASVVALSAPGINARDRGFNQPGAVGGTAGVGAPGAGARDPGLNQPGAVGNRGVGAPGVAGPGVGAPGRGAWDPGLNQPGIAGNVGGVARRSVRRF